MTGILLFLAIGTLATAFLAHRFDRWHQQRVIYPGPDLLASCEYASALTDYYRSLLELTRVPRSFWQGVTVDNVSLRNIETGEELLRESDLAVWTDDAP